jgi:putative membrane protein
MHEHGSISGGLSAMLLIPAVVALGLYVGGVLKERRRGRVWPVERTVLWTAGVTIAAASVLWPAPPVAGGSGFVPHMWRHLLVGMMAPLLMVLAAPVTLALRALSVVPARRLSRLLRSFPARVLTFPVVAAVLNVGGVWLLYASPLYSAMEGSVLIQLAVHAHFLLAGYLFTASLIGVDPAPHRRGVGERAAVLIAALAAHGILAKLLFASPPPGVSAAEAEVGSMLMFYGGDLIDATLIALLCLEWYRRTAPNRLQRIPRLQVVPGR